MQTYVYILFYDEPGSKFFRVWEVYRTKAGAVAAAERLNKEFRTVDLFWVMSKKVVQQ